jgi:hypothetical protein
MEKALEAELLKEKYASMPPERREEIKNLAYELTKDQDFLVATELLEKSPTINIDESKFKSRLSLVAALSVSIASAILL